MALGLVGKKCGMTRVFTEAGEAIPVTVISVESNCVTQLKTEEQEGYRAVQVSAGKKAKSRLSKPLVGHFAKAGVEAGAGLQEFRLDKEEHADIKLGDILSVDMFKEGQKVDVRSRSRGKGYAGVIKRHNFKMQDATHGNSLSHRAAGSTGQCQTPGRVFKGKKMAGQMGNAFCTVQSQVLIKVDTERQLLLIKGAVPGAPGAKVIITKAMKVKEEG